MATKNSIDSNIPIEIAKGGTNTTSFSHTYGVAYFDGTGLNTVTTSTSVSRFLSNSGTGNSPAWAQVDLATGVTGTLPIANGGTNTTSFTNTDGVVYYDGTSLNNIATGSSGQVLTSSGAGYAPSFQTFTGGGSPLPIGALEYFCNANGDSYLSPNWLLCDGSTLPQATYTTLYSRLGLVGYGSWTNVTTTAAASLMCYGGGKFLAGYPATETTAPFSSWVFSSTDGMTWTDYTTLDTDLGTQCIGYALGNYIAAGNGLIQTSTDAITWGATSSVVAKWPMTSISEGFGRAIITGDYGIIASSTDLSTWDYTPLANGATLVSCATTSTIAIAVGNPAQPNLPAPIEISPDGLFWGTPAPSIGTTSVFGGPVLSYDGSRFIGCGATQAPFTSTDGVYWGCMTNQISIVNPYAILKGGNGEYVLTGSGGYIATSTDGQNWFQYATGIFGNVWSLAYGAGKWVYGGEAGQIGTMPSLTFLSAADLATATEIPYTGYNNGTAGVGAFLNTYDDSNPYLVIDGVSTTTGMRVLVKDQTTTAHNGVYEVTNIGGGVSWIMTRATDYDEPSEMAVGTGVPVLSGDTNARTIWVQSSTVTAIGTDAVSYATTMTTLTATGDIYGLAYGSSVYVAVGGVDSGSGYATIATSTDATTWADATVTTITMALYSVVAGDSLFVSGGAGGTLFTSTNGTGFATVTSPTSSDILSVNYLDGKYFYGGYQGALGTSTDALTWTNIPFYNFVGYDTTGLACDGDGNFVLGGPGFSATSTDGTTWNLNALTGLGAAPSGVANNGAIWMISSDYPDTNVYTSTDVLTWATHASPQSFSAIGTMGSNFIGVCSTEIDISTDGVTWYAQSSGYGGSKAPSSGSTTGVVTSNGFSGVWVSLDGTPYDHTTSFMLPTDADMGITVETTSNFKRGLYIKAL